MEKKISASENERTVTPDTLFIQHLKTQRGKPMISVFGRRPKEGNAHLSEAAAANAMVVHDTMHHKKGMNRKMYTKNGVEITHGMEKSSKTLKK